MIFTGVLGALGCGLLGFVVYYCYRCRPGLMQQLEQLTIQISETELISEIPKARLRELCANQPENERLQKFLSVVDTYDETLLTVHEEYEQARKMLRQPIYSAESVKILLKAIPSYLEAANKFVQLMRDICVVNARERDIKRMRDDN
jgi:hypothetical protein